MSRNGFLKMVKVACYRPIRLLLVIIFLTSVFSEIHAQEDKDYAIHANIIYYFTKYIDWPAYKKSGDFIIGVLGDSPLYDELITSMSNKTVGRQKIVIRRFSSREPSYTCHILFIGEDESATILKKVVQLTAVSPVLLVSEEDGLARNGSCINFIVVSNHLRLEINKSNIEQRGLSIASELLQLGKLVK